MKPTITFRISESTQTKLREILGSGPFKLTATSIIEHGIDLAHQQFMAAKNPGETIMVDHGEKLR